MLRGYRGGDSEGFPGSDPLRTTRSRGCPVIPRPRTARGTVTELVPPLPVLTPWRDPGGGPEGLDSNTEPQ
jgi:hypothetical protein